MAALGAAMGSTIGRFLNLTPRERRVLLIAGCAAGVGAIFQCPLGGALFATSILYSEEEFEAEAMAPAFVASVIAYTTFQTVLGGLGHISYLLNMDRSLTISHPIELIPFAGITDADVRRAGEPDRETLRCRAAHAGPIDDGTFLYRVEFHPV